MHTPEELEKKLWKAIKSDRTLMLGLDGAEDGHTRPMTALLEHEGLLGQLLALVQSCEESRSPTPGLSAAALLRLDSEQVQAAQQQALAWAGQANG